MSQVWDRRQHARCHAICMVGIHHSWQIFSTDRDFSPYATVLPIQLFSVA